MSRLQYTIGDGTPIAWTFSHNASAITLDVNDTIKAKVIGDKWESEVITLDLTHDDADLASGVAIVEPSDWAPWTDWLAGDTTWEFERTPNGTSLKQTYRYPNCKVWPNHIP